MKIAKYGTGRVAAVVGEKLIDLNKADPKLPHDLREFIAGGDRMLEGARNVLERAKGGSLELIDIKSTKLLAPLVPSAKLICMGRNFASHSNAMRAARASQPVDPSQKVPETSHEPKRPAGFLKITDTCRGPGDDIIYPTRTKRFDYEVEVAAIIGRQGKDIPIDETMSHVWGYSVFCDYSARDQTTDLEDMNWVRHHKNFDCAAALGPWIVTADEIPDPHSLALRSIVNGQVRQDGNTSDMIYKFPRIIEYYSVDQTLYPGDLFASGTPGGVGAEKKDGSWLLKPGDTIEFDVPAIGRFSNRIVAKPAR
jgi:2-keto-4-pentenoate hydratase/2-oxohepta-3-ene-1,7-dioic acid hydratase in catechol pathway